MDSAKRRSMFSILRRTKPSKTISSDLHRTSEVYGIRASDSPDAYSPAQRHEGYRHNDVQLSQSKSKAVANRMALVEAEKSSLERHRAASTASVRHLRELIRKRHRLDLCIWNEREVLEADRNLVIQDCKRADEILVEIYSIVDKWDQALFSSDEWKVAKKIKDGVLLDRDKAVIWGRTPPWTLSVEDVWTDDEWWEDDPVYQPRNIPQHTFIPLVIPPPTANKDEKLRGANILQDQETEEHYHTAQVCEACIESNLECDVTGTSACAACNRRGLLCPPLSRPEVESEEPPQASTVPSRILPYAPVHPSGAAAKQSQKRPWMTGVEPDGTPDLNLSDNLHRSLEEANEIQDGPEIQFSVSDSNVQATFPHPEDVETASAPSTADAGPSNEGIGKLLISQQPSSTPRAEIAEAREEDISQSGACVESSSDPIDEDGAENISAPLSEEVEDKTWSSDNLVHGGATRQLPLYSPVHAEQREDQSDDLQNIEGNTLLPDDFLRTRTVWMERPLLVFLATGYLPFISFVFLVSVSHNGSKDVTWPQLVLITLVIGASTLLVCSSIRSEVSRVSRRVTVALGYITRRITEESKIFSKFSRYLRPTVERGYQRLEWRCKCGREMYGDYRGHGLQRIGRRLQLLQPHSGFNTSNTSNLDVPAIVNAAIDIGSHPTSSDGSASPETSNENNYSSSSTASSPGSTREEESLDESSNLSALSSSTSISLPSCEAAPIQSYLELCVNRNKYLTRVGEVPIVNANGEYLVKSDFELFGMMLFYIPARLLNVKLILRSIGRIKARYNELGRSGFLAYLYRPRDIRFIHFGIRRGINQVGIYNKEPNEIPPKREVEEGRYHYFECPLPQMPPIDKRTFFHYFWEHASHAPTNDMTFHGRLPKKLGCSIFMAPSETTLTMGWGIHIIEGPNWPMFPWIVVTLLTITLIIPGVYDAVF